MSINIHPADELAAIRDEIRQLEAREKVLRDALVQGPAEERDGVQYKAVVIPSTRESIDKEAIIAALGREVVDPFIRKTNVSTLKVIKKEA